MPISNRKFSFSTEELKEIVYHYRDEPDGHASLWLDFYHKVNKNPVLKRHRDFVELNDYGFGDRSFHYLWKLLVDQMPDQFSFLEVGVFKGQILSLVPLLARVSNRRCHTYGVTPLTSYRDRNSKYPETNYRQAIEAIFRRFEVPLDDMEIVQGFSTEEEVQRQAADRAPFDIVYLDGCHEYEVVIQDLRNYATQVSPGGFLVVDDASTNLNMPMLPVERTTLLGSMQRTRTNAAYTGHKDVGRAVRELLDPNPDFQHLFAVGHNRVWQRVA